jgi:K+-sensing histidine kinase KdpD
VVSKTSSLEATIPLAFVAVILMFALMYGTAVGVLGTLISAAIFAIFMFKPLGTMSVSDSSARMNLAWMMAAGVSLSFLLVAPRER